MKYQLLRTVQNINHFLDEQINVREIQMGN